jgi:hypothetical protein
MKKRTTGTNINGFTGFKILNSIIFKELYFVIFSLNQANKRFFEKNMIYYTRQL